MSRLKQRILGLIEADGPIGVDRYMTLCLLDPRDGYYTTREPFGVAGDFVTAPEVSQMFGELVAVWLAEAWRAAGFPAPFTLAEIGPGRGTLMADMLRTLGKAAPAMLDAARIVLVEASPRLVERQKEKLASTDCAIEWIGSPDGLPGGPVLIVGNEIFDALPMRQLVLTASGWRERKVGARDGALVFVAGEERVPDDHLTLRGADAAEGAILEISPARAALMGAIADRIAADGGAALFFDYGRLRHGPGDTLQAVRRHRPVDPLETPGEADLTSHVDFEALAAEAHAAGLTVRLATQGDFLLAMGLLERAGQLGADLDGTARATISAAVDRLAGPGQMGDLFKVIAVARPGVALPGFGRAD